jgi:hypothetical protein
MVEVPPSIRIVGLILRPAAHDSQAACERRRQDSAGIEARLQRAELVEARVHLAERLGRRRGVLGEVDPAAAREHEAIERAQEVDDEVTADLFIKTSHGLDRALWFLEATLDGEAREEEEYPALPDLSDPGGDELKISA